MKDLEPSRLDPDLHIPMLPVVHCGNDGVGKNHANYKQIFHNQMESKLTNLQNLKIIVDWISIPFIHF